VSGYLPSVSRYREAAKLLDDSGAPVFGNPPGATYVGQNKGTAGSNWDIFDIGQIEKFFIECGILGE